MLQTELKNEFNQLIQEISKEVLELSVSKSMESAAYTVKEQVPVMSGQIKELKKVLENLQWLNSELTKQKDEQKARENRVDNQLKNIIQKVDGETSLVKEIKKELTGFRNFASEKFELLSKDSKIIENSIIQHSSQLEAQLKELDELTDVGVTTGARTQKLVNWTLIFSIGSFGILTTILLHTLKVITL